MESPQGPHRVQEVREAAAEGRTAGSTTAEEAGRTRTATAQAATTRPTRRLSRIGCATGMTPWRTRAVLAPRPPGRFFVYKTHSPYKEVSNP